MFEVKGLLKANFKTILRCGLKGCLTMKLWIGLSNQRNPMSDRKREAVRRDFQSALSTANYAGFGEEKNKIKELVHVILFYENPRLEDRCLKSRPSLSKTSLGRKIHYQIDEIYESMRRKYEF